MMERTCKDNGIERVGAEREEFRMRDLVPIPPSRLHGVGVRVDGHDRMSQRSKSFRNFATARPDLEYPNSAPHVRRDEPDGFVCGNVVDTHRRIVKRSPLRRNGACGSRRVITTAFLVVFVRRFNAR